MEQVETNGKKPPKVMTEKHDAKEAEAEETSSRAMDPELRAMQQIKKILNDLDAGAQHRVMCWVMEKISAARMASRPLMDSGLAVMKRLD